VLQSLDEAEREQRANAIAVELGRLVGRQGTLAAMVVPRESPMSSADTHRQVEQAHEAIETRFRGYLFRTRELVNSDSPTAETERRSGAIELRVRSESNTSLATLAATLLETECECRHNLAGLDDASRDAVVETAVARVVREQSPALRALRRVLVGGSYNEGTSILTVIRGPRRQVYARAVHELIHAYAHPAFRAAFRNERNIVEGFTEYFTRQIVGDDAERGYEEAYATITQVRGVLGSSRPFPIAPYSAPEESLRWAYFGGRLDRIGWRPRSTEEEDAVTRYDGVAAWNPQRAASEQGRRERTWREEQQPHENIIRSAILVRGNVETGSVNTTVNLSYARAIVDFDDYRRGRLLLEGQLLYGTAGLELGAGAGLTVEYQEPWLYFQAGVNVQGTVDVESSTPTPRVDISPHLGLGIRAWQVVRIGVQGFALLPVTGQSIEIGGGGTVGIEF
jgi:hypothetical protein